MIEDEVSCVINHIACAMREAFDPRSEQPPVGGGSADVRLFAGDATPLAAWDFHTNECGCDVPFLWVRLMRRYRTETFPAPAVSVRACDHGSLAASFELGVGRCAAISNTGLAGDWNDLAKEAEISIDDSWRLDLALCRAMKLAVKHGCVVATGIDAVIPYGPEGGVLAWLGTAYVQL